MNKKLAIIAVATTVLIILGGFNSTMFYTTQYLTSQQGYSFSVSSAVSWWDCNWSYCKKITIDHTKVQASQSNYPVLLHRDADADLATYAQSDGDDICFVDRYNTTKYPHEIEEYNSTTGELTAWVKLPSVSSTEDTILYMYYGNPTCSNQQNISGTWNSNYAMVQHLNESSGVIYDSTSNDNDGTNNGATYNSSAKIDGAYDFVSGDKDYIRVTEDPTLNITQKVTVSAWIKTPSLEDHSLIASKGRDNAYTLYASESASYKPRFSIWDSGVEQPVDSNYIVTDDKWHYVVGTFNGTQLRIYIDGELNNTASYTGDIDTTVNDLIIGEDTGLGPKEAFNGVIDELRISNINRSTAWINTSYYTMYDPGNFTAFGKQEIPNVAPAQSNPVPSNGATGINPNPTLYITVNDTNADAMNVTFRTNASGTWQDIGSNNTVYNGTYSQTPTNMNQWGTKYWWSVNVTDGELWNNQTYNFTTTTFNYITFYFDDYNTSEAWPNNPEYMVDGSTTTFANCEVGTHVQNLINNTCDGTNLGTIEKVEIRCYGDDSDNVQATYLSPVFNGTTDGNNYDADISPERWSNYSDITNDPAGPGIGNWTWTDIQNLDMDVEANGVLTFGNDYVARVEIRVNYSTSPYLYTFNNGRYTRLTDFIPGANSREKEYTQSIDITKKTDTHDGILKLKITEELNETTYLDCLYIKVDETQVIKPAIIINNVDKKPLEYKIFSSWMYKQLLKESDNEYFIMNTGDEYIIEFIIPTRYHKIEFVAEGYYIKQV